MRSRVVFLLAIIMGIFTTVLFFQYIQGIGHSQEVVQQEEMVEVIVAVERIGENQTISSEMLDVIQVAKSSLHPSTVQNKDEIVGSFSTTVIESGEVVLSHRFKSETEEKQYVSRKVTDGYRAVSVWADFVRSVSNLIEPEDYVDVVLTEEIEMGEDDMRLVSDIILSKVRVLAVGRKMTPPVGEEGGYVEYSSLTLELKPEDSTRIINASENGTLHFILHSSIDQEKEAEE